MKKNILLFFSIFLFTLTLPVRCFALETGDIVSETAVLMDAETGQVLFDKNGDRMMYPASTTKIMTSWLAAENCDMDEIAEVTQSAVDIDEWNSANMALSPGERLPVDSLMYGLMLPSANDAANVLAEHIAGNQRDFAQIMTEKARSAGAVNTHFANAHGLHDPNHYTTAYDIAMITRAAMRNSVFMRYFGTALHTIPPTNLQPLERPFTNYQYMLVDTSRFFNPDVIGGKVGFTSEAMHTMSTAAQRNGRTLICVVMHSPHRDDKFADTEKLLSFGFDEFTEVTVPSSHFPGFSASIIDGENQTGMVNFKSAGDFTALLHDSLDLSTLKISYSHDYAFNKEETVASFAEFSVATPDNPAIPASLGKLALEPEITMFADMGTSISHIKDEISELLSKPWAIPLILSCFVAIIFISLFISRQIGVYMQIKRRRKRLERSQRISEALYRGPTPRVTPKEKIPR